MAARRHAPPRRVADRPRRPRGRRRSRRVARARARRRPARARLPRGRPAPPGSPVHRGPQPLPPELQRGERAERHARGTERDDLHRTHPGHHLPRHRGGRRAARRQPRPGDVGSAPLDAVGASAARWDDCERADHPPTAAAGSGSRRDPARGSPVLRLRLHGLRRRARGAHPRRLRRAPGRLPPVVRRGERDGAAARRRTGHGLRERTATAERLDPSPRAAGAGGVRRRHRPHVGAALRLFPRLAGSAAPDDLGRPRRALGLRPHAPHGLRLEPADARHPLPDHGARGQPLGPDARPVLRGAGARPAEVRRDRQLLRRPLRTHHGRHPDRRPRRAGDRDRRDSRTPPAGRHRDALAAVADCDRAPPESDRLQSPPRPRPAAHPRA